MEPMKRDNSVTPEMLQEIEIPFNENREACSKCGGQCCIRFPCDVYPQDVKKWFKSDTITKEMIIKLLDTKLFQLDWWEGDVRPDAFDYTDEQIEAAGGIQPSTYYIHARVYDNAAVQGSYGGRCRFFELEKGCMLPWEVRPTGGKALIPPESGDPRECSNTIIEKAHCALAWSPYYDILDDIYMNYEIPEDESKWAYMDRELKRFTEHGLDGAAAAIFGPIYNLTTENIEATIKMLLGEQGGEFNGILSYNEQGRCRANNVRTDQVRCGHSVGCSQEDNSSTSEVSGHHP